MLTDTTLYDDALRMDNEDPLKKFRNEFHLPQRDGKELIYLCGNSLGLQPKRLKHMISTELDKWSDYGVEGHFKANEPWISYHELLKETMAEIVGAERSEIVIMNMLTVNIHLLLVSFYSPKGKRNKIICEKGAFPSDMHALISQVKFHGLDPDDIIIELEPRPGEALLQTKDIVKAIEDAGEELALIWMGGLNYYTGQAFDIEAITAAGHTAGAYVGFDLAHAAGNIELNLHEADVDFAAWCTYKYLNSGPGGIGAAFIHSKHVHTKLPRFEGWWGNDLQSRFAMRKHFVPSSGAEAWALSTSPILLMTPLRASLQIFKEAGFPAIIAKRNLMTAFLERLIMHVADKYADDIKISIITPTSKKERGAQLSIIIGQCGKSVFNELNARGIICDWREPEVIRLAPAPLYNSFTELYEFSVILDEVIGEEISKRSEEAA